MATAQPTTAATAVTTTTTTTTTTLKDAPPAETMTISMVPPAPEVENLEEGMTIRDLDIMSFDPVVPYSMRYFGYCGLGGGLATGFTISLMNPIDLIKTNRQINPKLFPHTALSVQKLFMGDYELQGFRNGLSGMYSGARVAAIGYGIHGYFRFGFYEYFKWKFGQFVGEERAQTSLRDLVRVTSISLTEAMGVLVLCPFETLRVRLQSNPSFAHSIGEGFAKIHHLEGFGSLYSGLGLLWARQIPTTAVSFVAFERIAETLYRLSPTPKRDMTTSQQTALVFTSGYLSGALAAVVTHPWDTLFSMVNRICMYGTLRRKVSLIYNGTANVPGIGWKGLWKGLSPRIFWLGTVSSIQWSVYSSWRALMGLSTPGDDYRYIGEPKPPLAASAITLSSSTPSSVPPPSSSPTNK